jgi:diguanylate cyclase (GGDEF)-like protein/PAS domain S-box-containing protein
MNLDAGPDDRDWPKTAIHMLRTPVAVVAKDGFVLWANWAWDEALARVGLFPRRGERQLYHVALRLAFGLHESAARDICDAILTVTTAENATMCREQRLDNGRLLIHAGSTASLGDQSCIVSHIRIESESDMESVDTPYQDLIEGLPAIVYVQHADPLDGMIYMSRRVNDVLGYGPEDYLSDPSIWIQLIHSDDQDRVLAERMRTNEAGSRCCVEYRVIARDGRIVWIHDESLPILDADGRAVFRNGILLDISERKVFDAQLVHQAFHDQLTGLPSRALFMNRLEAALARSERRNEVTAVLFLDLDRFKAVNDTLGHAAGDELLIQLGERLRAIIRPGDTVARIGGDEFIVLAEDISTPEIATRVASRIITGVREPFTIQGQEVFITTSIGIAFSLPGVSQASELVRDADIALYRAKAEGRARYTVFDTSVDLNARERLNLETSLRRAVDENEFVIHYQPIVSLDTGIMTGTEALLRWEHPTRGLLLPGEFLDVAEDAGLMTPIGQNLLFDACRQGRLWQQHFPERPPLTVVVNLSANQFRRSTLVEQVRGALEKSGLAPGNLRLEVTEDTIAYDRESALAKIRALKELGVQLSIDGFGLGYTSLANLVNIPVDTLEIDRTLISGTAMTKRTAALVQAIASLANALGAEVSAEGIETREQLIEVISAGIRRGQGNLFAHPGPADMISRLLEIERDNLASQTT